MTFNGHENVKVSILGKEYSVVCGSEQRDALQRAAGHLNDRMQQIQRTGKVIGVERCAIMAALNITYELLELKKKTAHSSEVTSQLQALTQKLEAAVQEQKRLL